CLGAEAWDLREPGRLAPPAKIDDPVRLPGLPAVGGAVALPMCGVGADVRPGETRKYVLTVRLGPFTEQIDLTAAENSSPDMEVGGLEAVGPGVLPLASLPVVRPQADPLESASVVDPFEELERHQPVEDSRSSQCARRLHPAVGRWNAACGVPLSVQKIELPFRIHIRSSFRFAIGGPRGARLRYGRDVCEQERTWRCVSPARSPKPGLRLPSDGRVRGGRRQVEADDHLLAVTGRHAFRRTAASDELNLPQSLDRAAARARGGRDHPARSPRF